MEIVVKLFSGLGNQLFQYAAGRYYAHLHKATLRVTRSLAHHELSHNKYARPFMLSHFALREEASRVTFWDRLMLSKPPAAWLLTEPLKQIMGIDLYSEPIAERYRFLPSLAVSPGTRTLYLTGYWQTYLIVETLSKELRHELRFKEEAQGENAKMLNRIRNTPNSVSFHVRRGDYALAVEGNIVLPRSYYTEAIALIQQRLIDPTFFVFSDDIGSAKDLLPENIRKIYVAHNDDFSSYEDLRLMSACEHHIIANSTFSWWGAWLGSNSSKTVIAPRHWHLNKQSYYPDLLPPEWLLIDTDVR